MSDPRSVLTSDEVAKLQSLVEAHTKALIGKDYATADVLRTTLMEWGAWPPEKGWHPVFESSVHRQQRLESRETSST